MAGFFRHYLRRRSQIKQDRRRLGAMRLARKRRENICARQSLRRMQIAASEMEGYIRMRREENQLDFVSNLFSNRLVNDFLAEIENDPLIGGASDDAPDHGLD